MNWAGKYLENAFHPPLPSAPQQADDRGPRLRRSTHVAYRSCCSHSRVHGIAGAFGVVQGREGQVHQMPRGGHTQHRHPQHRQGQGRQMPVHGGAEPGQIRQMPVRAGRP